MRWSIQEVTQNTGVDFYFLDLEYLPLHEA